MERAEEFRGGDTPGEGYRVSRRSGRPSSAPARDFGCQLGAVGQVELGVDVVQVDLHGAFGESKPLRYFLVGQTFGYDPDDLAFTRSERVNVMVSYPG